MGGLAVAAAAAATGLLGPATPRAQTRPTMLAAAGAALRSWDPAVDRMTRDGALQRRRLDADPLVPARSHERLDQYYRGVRVYGADLARQTDAGSTVSIFGTVYDDLDLDVTPAIDPDRAAALVMADLGVELGPQRLPTLMILPQAGRARLVYHATAFSDAGGFEYFIDARSGEIITKRDAIRRQSTIGTGVGVLGDTKKMSVQATGGVFAAEDLLRPPVLRTYDMRGNLARVIGFLNGVTLLTASDRAIDTDNSWTDAASVDAHAHAGYTYDYYFKRFGRRGLDDHNLRLLSLVHPANRSTALQQSSEVVGAFYANAGYWGGGVMVYGDGLPPGATLGGLSWNYLAGGLDVVGHELTHGVTEYTSGLIYAGESGALNESFSDMMGTAIEFYYQPPGSGPRQADYLIAEDVVTPGGLRSMEHPQAFGDPDHYSRRYVGAADNGGVHTNSGIGNQWYYLAIEGGTNRTSGLAVSGVGRANREQIERIAYRAFTQLLTSGATFAMARQATIQAARDLYGAGSSAERAVTEAWTAVGVN